MKPNQAPDPDPGSYQVQKKSVTPRKRIWSLWEAHNRINDTLVSLEHK